MADKGLIYMVKSIGPRTEHRYCLLHDELNDISILKNLVFQ